MILTSICTQCLGRTWPHMYQGYTTILRICSLHSSMHAQTLVTCTFQIVVRGHWIPTYLPTRTCTDLQLQSTKVTSTGNKTLCICTRFYVASHDSLLVRIRFTVQWSVNKKQLAWLGDSCFVCIIMFVLCLEKYTLCLPWQRCLLTDKIRLLQLIATLNKQSFLYHTLTLHKVTNVIVMGLHSAPQYNQQKTSGANQTLQAIHNCLLACWLLKPHIYVRETIKPGTDITVNPIMSTLHALNVTCAYFKIITCVLIIIYPEHVGK